MTKKWLGNKTCDICGSKPKDNGTVCYDVKTVMGPWAFLCAHCFPRYGTNLGQMYDAKTFKKMRDM